MEWKQPYFLWNNRQTFERGQGKNIQISGQGITLSDIGESGIYYTGICDSRNAETEWDRIVSARDIPYPEAVRISVYSCETGYIDDGSQRFDLYEVMKDASISMEKRDSLFRNYKRKEVICEKHLLLHGIIGRFLWLRIELASVDGISPKLHRIQIFFPKTSWTDYLPEFYQKTENSFLDRFLKIFQTMYQEMNRQIEELPGLYSVSQTPSELLVWLSQWISVEDPYLWREEQLRYLIRHGRELANIRGTAEYMKRMLWLYTGTVPYIVEYWQWAYEDMDSKRRKRMEELYGADSVCVTVILEERALEHQRQPGVLKRLVSQCSPAHIDVRMEVLQPYIFLDRHSYLGVNSRLGMWGNAVLDGQNFLPVML